MATATTEALRKKLKAKEQDERRATKRNFGPPPGGGNEAARDDYLYWKGQIDKAEAELKPYQQKLKNVRRKAEDSGVNLGRLDFLSKQMKGDKTGKTIRQFMEGLFQEAAWLNLIPWTGQGDMFEVQKAKDKADEDIITKIYNDGRDAGIMAAPFDCPHDETSEHGQAWMQGYNDGQDVNKSLLLKHNEQDGVGEGDDA